MGKKQDSVYSKLRNKWVARHKHIQETLWAKHGDAIHEFVTSTKNFAIGSVSGLMLLTSPINTGFLTPPNSLMVHEENLPVKKSTFMIGDLAKNLPGEVRPLTYDEEATISALLTRDFGFKVVPELSGIRLNRSYGYIGAEQHLARYPGDTMQTHFEDQGDSQKYYSSGMAPGLGAWGYFARSRYEMTEDDITREKYYIATQTFLAPGFHDNVREYITFFKYRKMLVVNPENGKSMVVVIGDAGPAEWTGKSLGGSPEVMKYLERVDGKARGPVLYFFVDDPENKIPLGPIEPV